MQRVYLWINFDQPNATAHRRSLKGGLLRVQIALFSVIQTAGLMIAIRQ
jgi:hypothetical protein